MQKCIRVIADYRPKNENKPSYDYIVEEDVKPSAVKKWFSTVYSWLKVYECYEIPIEEARWPSELRKKEKK